MTSALLFAKPDVRRTNVLNREIGPVLRHFQATMLTGRPFGEDHVIVMTSVASRHKNCRWQCSGQPTGIVRILEAPPA